MIPDTLQGQKASRQLNKIQTLLQVPVPNLSGSVTTPKIIEVPADQSKATEVSLSKTGLTVFSSLEATNVSSIQGEQESRDLSVTIDLTRLGARPKTSRTPIFKEKEEDDLSEKVTTKDLTTETRMTTEAEVYPNEDAQLEAKMNTEFVEHMTKAANKFVSYKNAKHLKLLKEVTFSPIAKRGT
jgi:hypothetical protein